MILEFADREYVDVEAIVCLRWFPQTNKGVAVFNGERISLSKMDFEKVEDAYRWIHKTSIYGNDKKVKRLVERGNE
jgi:hypothetical protein